MKLDHPSDVCFKHSAISFGVPDMPPPDVGRSMGPISLHNAIGGVERLVFGRTWCQLPVTLFARVSASIPFGLVGSSVTVRIAPSGLAEDAHQYRYGDDGDYDQDEQGYDG